MFGTVAPKDTVRLADGTKLSGPTVSAAVADLKNGAKVAVSLRFDNGRTRVRDVRPKYPPKKKNGATATEPEPARARTAPAPPPPPPPARPDRPLVEAELGHAADAALGAGRPDQRQRSRCRWACAA